MGSPEESGEKIGSGGLGSGALPSSPSSRRSEQGRTAVAGRSPGKPCSCPTAAGTAHPARFPTAPAESWELQTPGPHCLFSAASWLSSSPARPGLSCTAFAPSGSTGEGCLAGPRAQRAAGGPPSPKASLLFWERPPCRGLREHLSAQASLALHRPGVALTHCCRPPRPWNPQQSFTCWRKRG